jgi:nucleotide-binding universal stress UspA family protein
MNSVGVVKSVMLVLSTCSQSSGAVELAIQNAENGKRLTLLYIVEANFRHYFASADIGFFPELKERCEEELLRQLRDRAEDKVKCIAKTARDHAITVKSYIDTGRFVVRSLKAIQEEKPELVIIARSGRPKWIRKLLGSPTDYLIAHAECPVIEA